MRIARRATLSSYAGPMPLPVVPILFTPRLASRATSMATWYGRMTGQASEIFRRDATSMPAACSLSISRITSGTDTTTPLPM